MKIIVIVVDKLTKSRVLRDRTGLRGAPRGGDRARKFFLSYGTGRE